MGDQDDDSGTCVACKGASADVMKREVAGGREIVLCRGCADERRRIGPQARADEPPRRLR